MERQEKNAKNSTANATPADANYKKKTQKKSYPPCQHCNKKGHPPFKCWRRLDAKCSKCNQKEPVAIICRSKSLQHEGKAKAVD